MSADRRMTNTLMIRSNDFNRLSFMAQALYQQLLADTDDFGVAEGESVIRHIPRMRKSALMELIENDYITLIRQDGLIVYINTFHKTNNFSTHGAKPSLYMAELQHNERTRNLISKVKIRNLGEPRNRNKDKANDEDKTTRGLCFDRYIVIADKHKFVAEAHFTHTSLGDYYKSLDEQNVSVTDTSIDVMIRQCIDKIELYGDLVVSDYIDKAVASGWKNINWQYLDREQEGDSYC